MTETAMVPFYRSYLLNGKTVYLDKLSELSDAELNMLNIETLAALTEARHEYDSCENKQSEEAGPLYRRLKVAGYFQAAIKLELENG
jgi:phosphoglycolate phosphatase-like HAD superfamily hydrolase